MKLGEKSILHIGTGADIRLQKRSRNITVVTCVPLSVDLLIVYCRHTYVCAFVSGPFDDIVLALYPVYIVIYRVIGQALNVPQLWNWQYNLRYVRVKVIIINN